jgi:hypothetical protein
VNHNPPDLPGDYARYDFCAETVKILAGLAPQHPKNRGRIVAFDYGYYTVEKDGRTRPRQ